MTKRHNLQSGLQRAVAAQWTGSHTELPRKLGHVYSGTLSIASLFAGVMVLNGTSGTLIADCYDLSKVVNAVHPGYVPPGSCVFDTARRRAVFFIDGDVWEFDGSNWAEYVATALADHGQVALAPEQAYITLLSSTTRENWRFCWQTRRKRGGAI